MMATNPNPTLNPAMKFRDLRIGQQFEFASIRKFPFSGMERGPWIKTGSRTYESAGSAHRLHGHKIKVGSINAEVEVQDSENPATGVKFVLGIRGSDRNRK